MIDLEPRHLDQIKHMLATYVPECRVVAYGSCVKGDAWKFSDLDLCIIGKNNNPKNGRWQLKEALEESTLPISVDVVEWSDLSEDFKKIIAEKNEVIQEGSADAQA